jgi:DNA modification methylase
MDVASIARRYFTLQNHIIWAKAIDQKGHYTPVQGDRFLNHTFEHVFHFSHRGDVRLKRLAIGIPYMAESSIRRYRRRIRCRGSVWFIPYESYRGRRPSSGNEVVEPVPKSLTVKQASAVAGLSMPYITIAANDGRLPSNGKKGRLRRIDGKGLVQWLVTRRLPRRLPHPAVFPVELAEMCIRLHGLRPGLRVLDPFVGSGTTLLACKRLGVSGVGIDISAEAIALARQRLRLL